MDIYKHSFETLVGVYYFKQKPYQPVGEYNTKLMEKLAYLRSLGSDVHLKTFATFYTTNVCDYFGSWREEALGRAKAEDWTPERLMESLHDYDRLHSTTARRAAEKRRQDAKKEEGGSAQTPVVINAITNAKSPDPGVGSSLRSGTM